jgi:hypothetical protein
MRLKEIVTSHAFQVVLYTVGGVLILLFVFQAGMFIGFEKASFSNRIGENYFREVSGNQAGPMDGIGMSGDESFEAHGAIGNIIELKLPLIVVEDDNIDKVIRIATSTVIRGPLGTENTDTLKINDFVTIFGSDPDENSVITARLIRILPPPPTPNQLINSGAVK